METGPDKYIVVYPERDPDPLTPLATIYPDGRIEATTDPQLMRVIHAAIEDDQTMVELSSVALYDDPAWLRHVDTPLESLLHDLPDDLAEAFQRHTAVLEGPACKYDSSTPEWAWLVCAALHDRGLDGRPIGYRMPDGYDGVGFSEPLHRRSL